MKLIVLLVVVVFMAILASQLSGLYSENRGLVEDVESFRTEVEALVAEGRSIQDDTKYFENLENLEKELRSRFDYRLPKETMYKY